MTHVKICQKTGKQFTITTEDQAFYQKMQVPEPTLCPTAREQRRLAWRNERQLYTRTCDLTGQTIISTYHKEQPFPVYSQEAWWSDKWDAKDYAQEIDWNRPFFEQFKELQNKVPRMNLLQHQNENSAYTNVVSNLKNCYMLFSSDFNRDCLYGVWIENSTDCVDCTIIDNCELCYENIFCRNNYNVIHAINTNNCSDSAFIFDCIGCKNCLLSYGLRNQEYCILNKQYTKEEYEAYLAKYPLTSTDNLEFFKAEFAKLLAANPLPELLTQGRVDNSTGNFLIDCENCFDCYEITNSKDCRYIQGGFDIKDSMDCSYVSGELGYENLECVPGPHNSAFNMNTYGGSNLYYCDMCMNNNNDCFGCVGIRQSQFCILNKQYSEEEYYELKAKLIAHMTKHGEWGEFFPAELSFYGYNETNAQDKFPLTKDQAAAQGLNWLEPIPINASSPKSQAKTCQTSGQQFIITRTEQQFYAKMGLAEPENCFAVRQATRNHWRKKTH